MANHWPFRVFTSVVDFLKKEGVTEEVDEWQSVAWAVCIRVTPKKPSTDFAATRFRPVNIGRNECGDAVDTLSIPFLVEKIYTLPPTPLPPCHPGAWWIGCLRCHRAFIYLSNNVLGVAPKRALKVRWIYLTNNHFQW